MARPQPAAPRARSTRSTVAEAAASLVYVHGIGQHARHDALKLEWDLALFGRDMGPRSRMVYWADIVHPPHPPDCSHSTLNDRESAVALTCPTLSTCCFMARLSKSTLPEHHNSVSLHR